MTDRLFRILAIEDNAGDAALFREALSSEGLSFTMDVVTDGSDAVMLIDREDAAGVPDLIILDLGLPRTSGKKVLQAIRKSRRFSDVAVVIASSPSSPLDRADLEDLDISLYFTKPCDLPGFLKIGPRLKEILMALDPMPDSAPIASQTTAVNENEAAA